MGIEFAVFHESPTTLANDDARPRTRTSCETGAAHHRDRTERSTERQTERQATAPVPEQVFRPARHENDRDPNIPRSFSDMPDLQSTVRPRLCTVREKNNNSRIYGIYQILRACRMGCPVFLSHWEWTMMTSNPRTPLFRTVWVET